MPSSLRITNGSAVVDLDSAALSEFGVIQYALRTPEIDVSSTPDPGDGATVDGVRYQNVSETCRCFFANTTGNLQITVQLLNRLFQEARIWQTERRGGPLWLEFQLKAGDPWYRSEILYGRSVLDERARAPWQLGGTSNDWLLLEVEWTRRFYWEASSEASLQLTNGNATNTASGIPIYNHDDTDTGSGYHDNWFTIAASQIAGDLPAPVRLEMRNDSTRPTKRVYLGRSYRADTYGTTLVLEGENSTVAEGSAASDDSCSNSAYIATPIGPTAKIFSWTLSRALLATLRGHWYRLMMRTVNPTPGTLVGARFRLKVVAEVTTIFVSQWVTLGSDGATAAHQLHDLGLVQLPPGLVNAASPLPLTFQLEAQRPTTVQMWLDFLYLLPTESARILVPKGYNTPNGVTLADDGASNTAYTLINDGIDRLPNYLTYGSPLVVEPGRRNTFYVLCDNDFDQSEVDRTHSVKLFYRPRRLTI